MEGTNSRQRCKKYLRKDSDVLHEQWLQSQNEKPVVYFRHRKDILPNHIETIEKFKNGDPKVIDTILDVIEYIVNSHIESYGSMYRSLDLELEDVMQDIRMSIIEIFKCHTLPSVNFISRIHKKIKRDMAVKISPILQRSPTEIVNAMKVNARFSYKKKIPVKQKSQEFNYTYIYHKMLQESIERVLSTLRPKEREILEYRFGFHDRDRMSLEEIGGLYGLSRERIRNIEVKALRKLRHPSRSRKVYSFLYD